MATGPQKQAVLDIKAFIDSNLSGYVNARNSELTVPTSVLGERNAFGLQRYPAAMFVPGPVYPDFSGNYGYEAELELYLGIAITNQNPETLVLRLWDYIDGVIDLVMKNPTLGGVCIDSMVEDVDPIYGDPQAKNVGLAVCTLGATIEVITS